MRELRYANRGRGNRYTVFAPDAENFLMSGENATGSLDDCGYRMLYLFRFWNVIEYFAPNRNLTDTPWSEIPEKYIWYRKYEEFINQKSVDEQTGKWWYTHKMLHRSASHIKRAIPEMFNYTRHDKIPKSSNSIESFFGHLKDNLRIHRGLSKEHFREFVKWYLFFKSNVDKINKK